MTHTTPILRFGVLADRQYADAEPWLLLDRHYRNSLKKLQDAIAVLNAEDLAFVVTLGDLIDRDWQSFGPVLEVYRTLRHESILLPGNHDFSVAPEWLGEVHARLKMPHAWHHFARGGIRFVVIDGNEVAAEGKPNAKQWNGGIGAQQFAWLTEVLSEAKKAGEKVIVFGHYPLYPENEHNLWGAERLTELFARSGNVLAYLNGHNHAGNLGRHGSTWYVNFKGMVDTEHENTFAVAEVFQDRIEIIGYGRKESRTLPL
ncbi:metallophosphoesterase [Rhizobium sp. NTR19]|uniref:Metallophosphoesterase n=1 Tax=Neorhizobium turbinariae TaxID=2937795 RepID=A0ABT0IRI3_9HYPH|nr:metallophosphoesterase [Neorhizobium turbinariae]MCK8780488.1 metallophosphoesterase [Neorhizobium turbinariae]